MSHTKYTTPTSAQLKLIHMLCRKTGLSWYGNTYSGAYNFIRKASKIVKDNDAKIEKLSEQFHQELCAM